MRRSSKSKLRGRRSLSIIAHWQFIVARPMLLYGSILIVVLLLSLSGVQMAQKFRTKAWSVLSPVVSTVSAPFIAISSFIGDITSYQKLQTDYDLLKIENERLMEWYLSLIHI